MNELARKRKELPTVVEVSKPYDSKSNGRAEGAVRRLESQVRTLKIATERNLGIVVDVHTPLSSWHVEHSADVLTKCSVGSDGRTPYERIKQKKYHGEMVEFASMVMVKLQGKLQGGIMKERRIPGLWLGKRWSSDEHLVSVASGRVVRARDVRLFSPDRAFDLEFARNVVGTPSNPSAVESEETVWHDVPRAPVARPTDPVHVPTARQAMLHKSYFEKFGYSANCPKCRALMRGEEAGPSHTNACRKSIEEEMDRDPILKQRLATAKERMDRYLASEVERGSTRPEPEVRTRESAPVVPEATGPDEDGIPEVGEDDGEEIEQTSKKARTGPRETEEAADAEVEVVDGSTARVTE